METVRQETLKKFTIPDKIERCGQCLSFEKSSCKLGYPVNAKSKPCRSGTFRKRQLP
jgi:hypothetical protein